MKNIQSDGIAEDLIRAFVQVGCAENHAKTLLEKFDAELTLLTDEEAIDKKIDEIQDITEEIDELAELRRSMMLKLFNMYDGSKDYWCMVKHMGIASMTAFEAYQASDDDTELLNMALEANKRFIKALSHFLGTEPTSCAACFADVLKAKKGE